MVGIKYPMAGVQGGCDGSPNALTLRFDSRPEQVSNVANAEPHDAGEAFEYVYGGGAGWGNPLDRPAESVLEDVLDEYVSLDAARDAYGVVITGSLEELDLAIDVAATQELRSARRNGA